MAYTRPGVQVTQKQETVSPTLIAPDLPAVVLGPAYRIVEISERDTDFTEDYTNLLSSGTTTTMDLFSGVSFDTGDLNNIVAADADLIYVDIVGTSADAIGDVLHIPAGHASLSLGSETNILTIDRTALTDLTTDTTIWVSGLIRVGWRALNKAIAGQLISVESTTEIEGLAGKRIPENPLAFGLSLAVSNAGTATYAAAMSGILNTDHDDVRTLIAGQDVYAIAPAVMLDSSEAASYASHCESRSAATEKMERIAFGSISRTLAGSQATEATTISAANLSIGNQRFFSVHPPAAYFGTKRHISTLGLTYLNAMNGDLALYAILDEKIKLADGTVYFKGQQITDTIQKNIATVQTYVNAYVPVPGAFWCTAVAGQVAGVAPQQGHTNLAIGGGLDKVKYSNDYFSQSQLNTIAAGGSYIISQSTPASAPACRHQLSTDMSSIETRELNIRKALDYVSKFLRNGLSAYIGTNNLTAEFIRNTSMTLDGLKNYLVREGIVEDLIIRDLSQDPSQKDTLLVTLEVKLAYPVNYIKITLAF